MSYLISTEQLAAALGSPDLVVLDASWHLPSENRDARAEYLEAHIPGALFFDIDALSDMDTDLPHMLPRPEAFASAMRRLGVGDGQRIVVYDSVGLYSAPRAWWMLRTMGARDVSVLDGGLPKWLAEGRPVESGPVQRSERHFSARRNAALVRDVDDVRRISESGEAQVVDARSPGRFSGKTPEPRAGLRSGHIPGSRNVHYAELVEADGTLKSPTALGGIFDQAGVAAGRPVVTSCGSGVTAAIVSLALAEAGRGEAPVYDGSWVEWGGRTDTPVETSD